MTDIQILEPSAIQQAIEGEISQQVTTAKRFPRNVQKFKQTAMALAAEDEETAASCFYSLPRGGKTIEGPSARLAEIVCTCWGNIRSQSRIKEVTSKHVVAEGACWDMETNNHKTAEYTRSILNKHGETFSADMVAVACNAACSIAERNAVFKVVPRSYVNSIYEECKKVAVGTQRTLKQRRGAAMEWFAKAGVEEPQVLIKLDCKTVEDIDLNDLVRLQGMRTAIQDDTTPIDTLFPPIAKEGKQSFKKGKEPEHDKATGEVEDPFAEMAPAPMEREAGQDG